MAFRPAHFGIVPTACALNGPSRSSPVGLIFAVGRVEITECAATGVAKFETPCTFVSVRGRGCIELQGES